MIRHELKDCKWYLIKKHNPINEGEWHVGMYIEHDNQFWIGVQGDNPKEYDEWVEIDPDLVFELFDLLKMCKNPRDILNLLTGIGSCARGPIE